MDVEATAEARTVSGGGRPDDPGAARTDAAGWIETLGASGFAKILLLAGLVIWLYWGHVVRLTKMWQSPDWSHGLLIVPFCIYLVSLRRDALLSGEHRGTPVGAGVILGSLAIYVAGIVTRIDYPQPLSMLTMMAGVVLLVLGWRALKAVWFPIAMLALAIPPPNRLYLQVTHPLQQGAAATATFVLNQFPGVVDIEREGIKIAYFMKGGLEGSFTVAGACSGMRSLMAFVFLGLAIAYFTQRPFWHRAVLVAAVFPVALLCNVVRVVVTGGFQMYGRPDLAGGTSHALLGFLMFGLGFAMYMGILWVVDHLVVEDDEADLHGAG